MGYRVYGRVRRSDNGQGIPNLRVRAYDVDWISSDDYLGSDITDNNGNFDIRFEEDDFDAGWFDPEGGPDIILKIWNPTGHLIYTSEERSGAGEHTYFDVRIPPLDIIGRYTVSGTVRDARSGRALCNLRTEAWDDDFIFDDILGATNTNVNGFYEIVYDTADFSSLFEGRPDVYVKVKNNDGRELARSWTRHEAPRHAYIDVNVGAIEISRRMTECIFAWTAAYRQEGTHVTVRIELNPDTGITNQTMQNLRNIWKQAIENKWGVRFACCCSMSAQNTLQCSSWGSLTFEVQWVTTNPHHSVRVRQGPAPTNMTTWDTNDSGDVASHEFGHMLGLVDEYSDARCPLRSPVNTGTIMDDNTEVLERHVEHFCRMLNENAVPIIQLAGIDQAMLIAEPIEMRIEREPIMAEELIKDRPVLLENVKKIVKEKGKTDEKTRITHWISGGAPGQRYEWLTVVSGDGSVEHKVKDDLGGKEEKYSAKFDQKTIRNLLSEILDTGLLELKEIGGPFLPDSMVGSITLEIDGKSTTYYYLADTDQRKDQKAMLKQAVAIIDGNLRRVAQRVKKRDVKTQKKIDEQLKRESP